MKQFLLMSKKLYTGDEVNSTSIFVEDPEAFLEFVKQEGPWPVQIFQWGEGS